MTDPRVVAAALGHGVSAELAARLLGSPRLSGRVAELLDARLGRLPDAPTPAQAAMLELDADGLSRLAMAAGAVWHGGSIAAVLDGAAVRALAAAIGPAARDAALRHRALAPALPRLAPEAIAAFAAADGAVCLRAWNERQPACVAQRLGPILPPAGPGGPAQAALGPGIVERLAGELA